MSDDPLRDEVCDSAYAQWSRGRRWAQRFHQCAKRAYESGWQEARARVHHIVRHAIKSQEENKRLRELLGEAIDCGYVDNPTPTWLKDARAALKQ